MPTLTAFDTHQTLLLSTADILHKDSPLHAWLQYTQGTAGRKVAFQSEQVFL